MRRIPCVLLFVVTGLIASVSGCASTAVPERLSAYMGSVREAGLPEAAKAAPLTVALVVINDTSAAGSAPPLSREALDRLASRLKFRLEDDLPLSVHTIVVQPEGIAPTGDPKQFVPVAQQAGAEYLLLAVLSSSEVEVPTQLPLQGSLQGGGGRGSVLGFRAENYALAELALVDGRNGTLLLRANGQAWAVLERLNVPLESNVYPVVRRDLTIAPIYPTEATAYDTLRAVAADDALAQAVMHVQEVWSSTDRQAATSPRTPLSGDVQR